MARKLSSGQSYKVKGPNSIGIDSGMILAGTRVVVAEVDRKGDLEGAGVKGEPTVIVEFEVPAAVMGEDGEYETQMITRRWSCSLDQFNDYFEEA